MILSPRLAVPVVALVGALALAGCGRKADPEVPRAVEPQAAATPVGIPVGSTAPATKPAAAKPEAKPKRSFLLDFLL